MGLHVRHLGIACLVAWGLAGCSHVDSAPQSAGGSPGTPATGIQNATLSNEARTCIWILSIDGKQMGISARGQNRLSPGRHTIRVQYSWAHGNISWVGDEVVNCAFVAKPGASLQIMCEHTEESGSAQRSSYKGNWKFWIEDASTREVVTAGDAGSVVTRGATGEPTEGYLFSGPAW